MASKSKPIATVYEGKVEIVDNQYLDYALLEDKTVVISQSSFYNYLEINTKDKKYTSFPEDDDTSVIYQPTIGDIEVGLPVMGIPAFCITIIELTAEKDNKELSRNAYILLMFLATTGLSQLIEEDRGKEPSPDFNSVVSGLFKVPPPKE